ncbi:MULTISPECIES: MotA/TolQ/ExbB proton channel family protein [Burkholderiaceae]|uniref:MotA/TolQ/ExbB proton channel family protein n=1 Tax=Burkholderiaceae TaxID=119060 RepID=UPI00141F15F7|nr:MULTISPECIES: MotA/TolQ/ExbB proton channel family protein [Burkholderiaceae]MBN3851689.1 MotA/TolQ/ExbB proton channel family protein [Paraburkholderia sp. Ac-20342]NIF54415.1 MotA/TolQ/ExbB proton channel family protein [Burkholderia sp. Ax-1724]
MQNYGIAHFLTAGDFVTRGIALALLVMSVLSWSVMIVKGWNVIRLKRLARSVEQATRHLDAFTDSAKPAENRAAMLRANPFLALALAGKEAAEHHRRMQPLQRERVDVSDWITRCLKDTMDESIAHLQSGLSILASVGSTAPFVGLLGTVWGIYHALLAIGMAGESSIDRVAGPVGEALIMTAFGLFVAIPAVLGYNALTRANKALAGKLKRFAHGLHAYCVSDPSLPASEQGAGLRLATVND